MTHDELRRLNIAMAMADSPKVLLLDEPTGTKKIKAFIQNQVQVLIKIL